MGRRYDILWAGQHSAVSSKTGTFLKLAPFQLEMALSLISADCLVLGRHQSGEEWVSAVLALAQHQTPRNH